MSEKLETLQDLFVYELKDLYSAEQQLIEALPMMQEAATNKELKNAFKQHLQQTKQQQKRLDQVAKKMKVDIGGEKCKAMEGLLKEGKEMMKAKGDSNVKDAGLIAAAQRVEHYEIAGYGTASHFAKRLGFEDVAKLLEETLEEEKQTDQLLNEIAIQSINEKAEK